MTTENGGADKKRSFDTYEATIGKVDVLTPRNKNIQFLLPPGKTMHFKSGQFVQVFVPVEGDKPRRTSYSIASSPIHETYFELCVTHVEGGKSSTYLHSLKTNDKVTVMGPLGKFQMPEPLQREPVFVCTGSGVAPFRSMISNLIETKFSKNIYLIFGNRFDGDIIYQKDWEALGGTHPNFKYLFTLSKPEKWKGEKGYVQDKIQNFVPDLKNKDYFICGLSNMINGVQEKLLSLGVPAAQIHFEKFD